MLADSVSCCCLLSQLGLGSAAWVSCHRKTLGLDWRGAVIVLAFYEAQALP